MRFNRPMKYFVCLLHVLLLFFPILTYSQNKDFVLVLDAGHGGKDPGAVGRISKEKDITLSVTRMLGELVQKNMKDVKVVYTRKTDVFVPLEQRAVIANNNHADLFISIHVNAAKNKTAYGAETYTLGLAKTQANLDVAMAENAVILLEDDYQTKYLGFDPNSIDSYIMFEFMMDAYLDNSITFATHVQNQLVGSAKRLDRGVRQAGFWVLHRSACSSVLVELGFISNYNEELYLASTTGQREMAQAIYSAFVKYKNSHDKKLGYVNNDAIHDATQQSGSSSASVDQPVIVETVTTPLPEDNTIIAAGRKPVFKLQITASTRELSPTNVNFKGLKELDYYREGGYYKYTVGASSKYEDIDKLRVELKKRFPDAFIVAFLGDKKIPVDEARKIAK